MLSITSTKILSSEKFIMSVISLEIETEGILGLVALQYYLSILDFDVSISFKGLEVLSDGGFVNATVNRNFS